LKYVPMIFPYAPSQRALSPGCLIGGVDLSFTACCPDSDTIDWDQDCPAV